MCARPTYGQTHTSIGVRSWSVSRGWSSGVSMSGEKVARGQVSGLQAGVLYEHCLPTQVKGLLCHASAGIPPSKVTVWATCAERALVSAEPHLSPPTSPHARTWAVEVATLCDVKHLSRDGQQDLCLASRTRPFTLRFKVAAVMHSQCAGCVPFPLDHRWVVRQVGVGRCMVARG